MYVFNIKSKRMDMEDAFNYLIEAIEELEAKPNKENKRIVMNRLKEFNYIKNRLTTYVKDLLC